MSTILPVKGPIAYERRNTLVVAVSKGMDDRIKAAIHILRFIR